jgi:hypothetical protein
MGLWSVVDPFRSMFVVGFVALALVAADAAGAPTTVCPGIAALFGGNGDLRGVAATSSRNVWAVGDGRGAHGHVTLVEHWNGKAWRARCSPDPSVSENFLNGVAAVPSTNAWAVGRYRNSHGTSRTLVEHWDGKAWKVQPSPNSGGSLTDSELGGVAAVSPTDAWAVGARFPSGGGRTLVEHWNAKAWKVQQSPNPGGPPTRLPEWLPPPRPTPGRWGALRTAPRSRP